MRTTLHILYIIVLSILLVSCFKEIDTEPIPRTVDETFTVQNSIKQVQTFFRFYENTVLEAGTASPSSWDLAFESAGEGNRVMIGWGTNSRFINTCISDFSEISQDLILDLAEEPESWLFNDPSYVTRIDSMHLMSWKTGNVYIHNRGTESDTYYVLQYISQDEESYTFRYASAQALDNIKQVTVYRNEAFNYVCFSYKEGVTVQVEPLREDWDIVCTPYTGWWETDQPGEYSPFFVSGILINNEYGVRVAKVFDPDIDFRDIDMSCISQYEFTDLKGAIGSDWKMLGAVGSSSLYTMDPYKKYLLKKYDYESSREMFFKLQIVDYKLDGEDHHPTIEFKYLGSK